MDAQAEFDAHYITSSEICKDLKINRGALMIGRKKGMLPPPIEVNGSQIYIWRRTDIETALSAWKFNLQARRGELKG
jgi:hypothetical protein